MYPLTLLVIAWAAVSSAAQQPNDAVQTARPAVSTPRTSPGATSSAAQPATRLDNGAAPQEPVSSSDSVASQQPQIIVTSPAPPAQVWQWHERVAWAASIVLAVLGYVGILLALRSLKNIERNSEGSLEAARAALAAAESSLNQTKSIIEAERPWILVSVEPHLTEENTFRVMLSNRGRRPGRIMSMSDQVHIVPNEEDLPKAPGHESVELQSQEEPLILLPGESLVIANFARKDVAKICKTDEQLRRIAAWEDTIFLFGRVTYQDLTQVSDRKPYETDWCCRYIHGETKSALLLGGPEGYNRHS